MQKLSKNKMISLFSIGACGLVSSAVILGTSCSNGPGTINPFSSSFETSDPVPLENTTNVSPVNITDIETQLTTGPTHGYGTNTTNEDGTGYTGKKSFEYKATYSTDLTRTTFSSYIYKDLNIVIGKDTEFSYKIFPNFADNTDLDLQHNLNFLSTYVTVDLLYNDNGSFGNLKLLSNSGLKDINGNGLSAREQGDAKCLYSYQWNLVKVDLHQLAGKHIHAIVISYDMVSPDLNQEYYGDKLANPEQAATNKIINGFIDDIFIGDKTKIDNSSLTNYVDTRRGTDGHMDWSRGSTFPATALPHGFNFYTPIQHAKQLGEGADWLYDYKKFNNSDNLPTLNGFGVSHEPAPWMHDYDQFCVMPQIGSIVNVKADERSLAYSHDNEVAQPDYYSVKFNNGIIGEIAPNDHSAIFKFTFPKDVSTGRIIFDSLLDTQDPSRDANSNDSFVFNDTAGGYAANVFHGWVENGAWGSGDYRGGQTRMFIYGEFSSSNFTVGHATGDQAGKPDRQYCQFTLDGNKTVEMKFATSYISLNQAKHNLDLEIKDENLTFNSVRQHATNVWNKQLQAIDLVKANATDEQKKTVYSNLYRINLYPNESFENVNTKQSPSYMHVSTVLPTIGDATDTETNGQIFSGKTYVNNGFWDTYRTVWPLYSILYPDLAKDLIDGFLYQYLEGGYVSRWSAPGYTDCMTGTSSDCAFANAYVNGTVTDINTVINIYNSGLADSFQYSSDTNMGRKGLDKSMYRGWTASTDIANGENMIDWDFQSWINDYALGQLAIKLSNDSNLTESLAQSRIGQSKQQIRETGEYLVKRSQNYGNLFDPTINDETDPNQNQFFRSKNTDSSWFDHDSTEHGDNHYDARQWGYEYVEGNGWNFAFTPVYDVNGLIGAYGGQDKLISKLDTFFSIPETGQHMGNIPSEWGIYSFTRETRDARFGQLVMSNQPSHHIPFMYAEAGRPAKTQQLTREILHRMFTGSDIGQGYVGDEDNGEMSSWYILSMIGLYDLALGKDQYVVTSPLFDNITINRDNGNKITVKTDDKTGDNVYIKSAKIDGITLNDVHVQASSLLKGNHTIEYKMSKTPTTWGERTITGVTRNLVADKCIGSTLSDVTTPTGGAITNIANLTDGDATTISEFSNFTNNRVELMWQPTTSIRIETLGLTSGATPLQLSNIKVLGSDNNISWTPIYNMDNQSIKNPYDTRIFNLSNSTTYAYYKIIITSAASAWQIAEIQLI